MNKTKKNLTLVLIILLLFSFACRNTSTPEAGTSDPAPEQEASVREPEPEPAQEVVESEPQIFEVPQGELVEVWRPAVGSYLLMGGLCESLKESAASELSGFEKFGEQFGIMLLMAMVGEVLNEWEAEPAVASFRADGLNRINALGEYYVQWDSGDISSQEFSNQLESECLAIEIATEDMLLAANATGLSQSSIESILNDIAESFSEMESEIAEAEIEEEVVEEILPKEVGEGRGNPFPFGEIGTTPGWDIQVLEIIRGEEAWQMIQAANRFNDPPSEGMEYILVKIWAKNTSDEEDERSTSDWDFKLTGAKYIRYSSASVVEPDPQLDATLFTGGETEGWVAFAVGQDEDNLVLILDELFSWDSDRFRYFALYEGAELSIPDEVKSVRATDLGTKRSEPAAFGETVTTRDFEVQVMGVIRGEEAYERIEAANMFNDPPDEGMEYILVKIWVRYVGKQDKYENISKSDFKTTGSKNVVYDVVYVVSPEPKLDIDLFPGGVYEGWVPVQVEIGETGIMLIYEPLFDWGTANRRYIYLEE
jgi:hypothetical protein